MTTCQTSTIYTGQLAVDMYDSANHDLVWRGVVSKTLDPKAKPEKRQLSPEGLVTFVSPMAVWLTRRSL